MLSDQDKIWELTGVLLTRKNKMQPAPTEEVDAFVLKLIATSPVFTKYKFFESLSRNGNALTFEKPFIPVKGTHYRVGYEYWCWYAKPCSHYEYQPWLQPKNPDLLASNFCRLLGFRKMTQARWSEPFQHSIVPGLNPDSHSQTLADISSGVFNGTFQTHAYGQGYTAILETVTCER